MKKFTCLILIISCCLVLTSCYQDREENSLEDYIVYIERNKCGFSSGGIDSPQYFLPSISFLNDFAYTEGGYHWQEDDIFRGLLTTNVRPEIAILYLKYSEDVYNSAKQTMLEEIAPYNDKFYEYGNYMFYENSNEINSDGTRTFPKYKFTMACYNDEKCILIFIGMYSGTLAGPSSLDKKYIVDIEGNWEDFIDQYYGEYYDFSE